ncbi:MAG TPA: DUF177 domain-containing protein [Terriglobia bacterium]|nr:DUF177 domain-containing protein [Terriglobia bacterium]
MLISVEQLELHPVSISETYPTGALDYHTSEFRQVGDLSVQGVAALEGSEIRFRGRLQTRVAASCGRCLGPVEIPVACEFDLTYRPMATIARNEEMELPPAELDVGFYEGQGIDTAEVATEQVNLFMPMQVVCSPDCRGLCPTCGANLNQEECRCPAAPQESPFATLLRQKPNRQTG